MEHVSLAVACNQVEAAGYAHAFLVEVDSEDFLRHVVEAAGRFLLHSEEVR